MPGVLSFPAAVVRGGIGILIRSLSPDAVDEIAVDGSLGLGVQMLYPPADAIAPGGPGTFETLFLVPGGVTLTQDGDVLLNFSASVQVTPAAGSVVAEGAAFQLLWDGAPLLSNRLFSLDQGAAGVTPDTFVLNVALEELVAGQAAGNHTLEIQWLPLNPASTTTFFGAGTGTLKVQGAL